ncbi:D-alanyl-D-alanine carboxypeptidase/D-alanyl-D-alanine-endopeptidase [Streptomyces sp. TLI_171]|uniref:D-alanyl-D-alanine carboxypeptidase/D-alanyl-D-alanine endopeptidase n=1 Tax=Streptomyces sp. TLI_171 TaxID=1938859 RepID=UPI000C175755|nr:D-alanyl-D-alanine carboxypeptidase/D-alanyl-D-alanine-endopeptidase [Streptomyces sp. TLI_171]RKE20596.1 D-alanyl-D-alanine carboxypeptidase/D-alanyl-D-alanine-endopeptidase (penicillin-binding protein 4) [Streptomyces sp. TLI_171]
MRAGTGAGRGRRAALAGVLGVALAAGVTVADPALAQPSPSANHGKRGEDAHPSPGPGRDDRGNGQQERRGNRHRAVPVKGPVLAAGDSADSKAPTGSGLRSALGSTVQDKSLGTLNFAVADAATGEFLFGSQENAPATPASTTKLATSVAALALLPADHRIATTVVQGAPGQITLVGGGDPTLTALPADQIKVGGAGVDAESAPASMAELARRTAAALKAAGTTSVKLAYDTSLYTGPLLHKDHDAMNIAAVTPLMVDEGRIDPRSPDEAPARVFDPAGQAADSFANFLKAEGITVQGKPAQATAGAGAQELARVESPVIGRLVERLLTASDNTLAEAVARQVAIAAGQPASFDGAAKAVTDRLTALGVPLTGVVITDGSGLAKANLIPPITLVKVLAAAASPDHPELRPVLTGLPIAGFTGTLVNRFGAKSGAAEAAGIVRAKTGTLQGVNTLAGTVVDADGRVLAFALMTRTTADPTAARAAVDRIVARIAACGC